MVHIGPQIPFIPEKAFYPIHPSGDGVYYSWRECTGSVVLGGCIFGHWKYREVLFRFDDRERIEWFISNDFGFSKRKNP